MNQSTQHSHPLPKCGDPECDHGETCQCDAQAFIRWLKAENYRLSCAGAIVSKCALCGEPTCEKGELAYCVACARQEMYEVGCREGRANPNGELKP